MKTFLTEKHNIPEGATHYFKETENGLFAWWDEDNALLLCPDNSNHWEPPYIADDISSPIPIPQTKEVEWENGEIVCKVDQIMPIGIFVGLDRTGRAVVELNPVMQHANNGDSFMVLGLHNIKKPEQEIEVERVERERANAIATMIVEFINTKPDESIAGKVAKVCAALYDAGYRKESD